MLKQITDRLAANIQGIVQKTIPLATQRHTTDGKMFPAIYKGSGQYSEISPDNYAGLSYFRMNGKVRISETDNGKRSMNDLNSYLYPIRLVVCVKNDLIGVDDEFSPDLIAMSFIKVINESSGQLKQDLEANFTTIRAESYDTDVKDILSEEFAGIERLKNSVPYQYSLIAIDINVEIIISTECINLLCKSYCS